VAVAEELSYRKASERLHVTRPAPSRQIKDLEAEPGVRLLDRDTGGVRLTEAGATFLAQARLALAQSQRAVDAAQRADLRPSAGAREFGARKPGRSAVSCPRMDEFRFGRPALPWKASIATVAPKHCY